MNRISSSTTKDIKIFTGSYNNCKSGNLVSISGDKGRSGGFNGNSYTKLAPKREFWNKWHNNIEKISEDENNKFYMEQFYEKVLSNLDVREILYDLQRFGNSVILLCFENEKEFCHRHLVATWLEEKLQIEIPEVAVDDKGNIKVLQRNLKYVREFRKIINIKEKGCK